MSDIIRPPSAASRSMPADLSLTPKIPTPLLSTTDEGPLTGVSFCMQQSRAYSPPATSPGPVQSLFKGSVQALSTEAIQSLSKEFVHPMSIGKMDIGRTEDKQGLDRPNGHTLNRGDGQGPDTPLGQGVSNLDEQPVQRMEIFREPVYLLQRDMASWTATQSKVLCFFRAHKHCVVSHKAIGEKLNIPYGTVRNILRRLSGAGMIRTKPYKNAAIQGIEVWYCGPGANQTAEDDRQAWAEVGHAVWTGGEQTCWTGGEQAAYMEEREKDRENIYIEKNQSILTLSKEQIDELWPCMGEAGLFARDIQKVKAAMDRQGIENKPEKIIAQSLRFIDWQLSQGPIIDQHGKKVLKPVAYWQASMMRNGCYQMPPGYIDPEVLALRQLADEENAKLEARRALVKLQAEKEKQARREELDDILRALADERESHPLWPQVEAEWTPSTRLEVGKNPQVLVKSPGIAATTRIALRKIYDWPE